MGNIAASEGTLLSLDAPFPSIDTEFTRLDAQLRAAAIGHAHAMEKFSLTALAREQLDRAREASSGRSAATVYGGHEHTLRQTVIALIEGHTLDEHENPGEATVHVLTGRVRLAAGDAAWEGSAGDLLVVPMASHSLSALQDSTILLTVAKA
jgi:quercetin dioxygenase-like cupin family protein